MDTLGFSICSTAEFTLGAAAALPPVTFAALRSKFSEKGWFRLPDACETGAGAVPVPVAMAAAWGGEAAELLEAAGELAAGAWMEAAG